MSSSILEDSKGEDDFHLLIDMDAEQESSQSNEEQQKILKKIFEEFKNKNDNQNNQGKKLCSSYVLKRLPNNKKVYSKTNPDGTTTETQVEKEPSGREKIIQTRYDKNNKVISRKVFYNINISNQNNNNNQNNINIQNNNNNNNNNRINNNNGMNNRNRGHIFRAGNGFTIETKYEALPNGRKKEIKIIRDENDIVVDVQEDEIFENNYMNMNMNQNNMYRNNNMNPYMPMPMNNMMNNNMGRNMPMNNNGYNPMNMGMMNMNMGMNNMNMGMMNMNMGMNNMNMGMNNMNSMPPMMNNFGNPYMNMMMPMPMFMPNPPNCVDPNILNSLPENEVSDASKMDPDSRNCVICLEDFKDKEKTIALPCIHVFHSECIKSWLGTHNCCPTCKFELTYQNINSHQM